MALSDPIVVTFDGDASMPLARTDLAKNKGTFISDDGAFELNISSTFSNKAGASTLIRLDRRKTAADPVTGVNRTTTASVWMVVRRPDNGTWNTGDLKSLATGVAAFVNSPNFTRTLVGEA